ncbi:PLC-like phosphodiesterase [Mycena albidolilacea]|uniref:PLC-like phosphodiesterase n=1 Tax=Mycena albidolilacea TaxID=1033008 RepID=A0AAD7A1D1_9AGAR|nr:PLC-like phosphodiesterase [Mycena albidolilacea]
MFLRSAWATLLSVATFALAASIPVKRATVCNGHAELCNRSYGNITFVGAHDSAFFSQDPLAFARDQEVDIPTQLGLGIRMLQAQSHVNDGVLHFCHTSCSLFDGGPVVDYLKTVKTFLDANPNEVLTLIFTNPEGQSPATVWKPLFDEAGITPLAFVPPSIPVKQADWPTLGSMIDSGKRVVVFMDAGADGADAVDFIMPEFQMIWEAPFSSVDPTFPCKIDRIAGPLADVDHMYMINHNLNKNLISLGSTDVLVSDPVDAPTTNGVDSILADANGCAPLGANRAPNFVLVDYVNLGDPFTAAALLNNLPLPAPAAQPSTGDQVADAAQGVADSVKGAAESAGDAIKSGVSSLGNSIKGLFGRA